MKKIILSLLAGGCMLSSCESMWEDTLNAPTQSTMDEQVIYSSAELAEPAVMAIIQSFCETNSYRGRFLVYYGTNTDFEWYNTGEKSTDDKARLSNYSTTATNGQMNTSNNHYAKAYEGIERANRCIESLRKYADLEHDAALRQLLGEALTLRSVYYLDLVKAYGDVPARFEPINNNNMYVGKSDRDVIYLQLLNDLLEAEDLVAWPNESEVTKSVERVSKAFVKGLRARVALYAGGYSQRPDGTIRLSNNEELAQDKMYKIAMDECLDIINKGCNQLGTFEGTFRKFNKEDLSAGSEEMWEIPFSEGRGRVIFDLGLPHKTKDKYTSQAKGGTVGPTPTAFYKYDPEDVRRDITCIPYYWNNGKQEPNKVSQWYFGKYRYEWLPRIVTSTNDDGLNWMYMRYADVILMAAEAINYFEGPTGANNAKKYLSMIVDRSLPAAKAQSYMAAASASKESFQNAIMEQRGLEFCGEMLRKADLIRWNKLGVTLAAEKENMTELMNRTGIFATLPNNIYWKTGADGETAEIYGLELNHTDEEGATIANATKKSWNGDWTDKINGLYINNPDDYQFWPIWQTFINASNGLITNDYNY